MHIRARAPLRLGLAGGGTDVSPYSDLYGGAVLNATLDMYAYCFITKTNDNQIVMKSRDYDESTSHPVVGELPIDGKLDLFKYIYNRLVKEFSPKLTGFELITHSDAPYGSGLGGSSTLVVAIIQCFAELWRLPLGEYDIAQLAYSIERKDAQLKGGKQDQYAATFGGVNYMEFLGDRVIVNPLRVKDNTLRELQASLLLCYTGRSRESAKIIETQISNVDSQKEQAISAMHQIKSDAFDMKEAILTGRLENMTKILNSAWDNKKKMSNSISNPEIDGLYNLALQNGALAGKVSGAGGGGFMMFWVDPVDKYDLKHLFSSKGNRVVDVNFTQYGSQSWVV